MSSDTETKTPAIRRHIFTIVQWVFALAIIGFAIVELAKQWHNIRDRLEGLDVHWSPIFGATVITLLIYALMIEAWRRTLAAWDTTLAWIDAARIWFAANLAKYLPGYIWSLTAYGVMARENGASGVAAAGSSVIVSLLNLASGLAVILMCGSRLISHPVIAIATLVAVVIAVLFAPRILPYMTEWFCRVSGKTIPVANIPASVIWLSIVYTGIAWIGYGVAFWLFAHGIFGADSVSGSVLVYIAVYTGAYILGLIAPISVAGLGVREGALVGGLLLFGVMNKADALILALTCRLWLTVLDVVPGLIAFILNQAKTRTRHA